MVAFKTHPRQLGEVAQRRGNRTRQLVIVEVQFPQIVEVAQCRRDCACQSVATEVQPLQLGEGAQCSRDGARQSVVVEPQFPQIGEATQRSRNVACQVVAAEIYLLQLVEIAQRSRDSARQLLAVELQPCHPRDGDSDALPGGDGSRGSPVQRGRGPVGLDIEKCRAICY